MRHAGSDFFAFFGAGHLHLAGCGCGLGLGFVRVNSSRRFRVLVKSLGAARGGALNTLANGRIGEMGVGGSGRERGDVLGSEEGRAAGCGIAREELDGSGLGGDAGIADEPAFGAVTARATDCGKGLVTCTGFNWG